MKSTPAPPPAPMPAVQAAQHVLGEARATFDRACAAWHPSVLVHELSSVRHWIAKAERTAMGNDAKGRPFNPLANYGTDELTEELRERGTRQRLAEPERFCDDCAHFVPWIERDEAKRRNEPPPKFNPCTRQHRMLFKMPDDHHDPHGGGWGFYRPDCADFKGDAEVPG